MNFIAATVVLKSSSPDPVTAYGLSYRSADAVVPGGNGNSEVRLRLLCYDRAGAKLDAFNEWKEGNRALITGNLVFSDDTAKPLDLIVTKERKNSQVAVKIGTTLDNSDVTTWLFLETHESRKPKLNDRIRKGRPICVQGYIREYRKDDSDSPYRAIVASDFTTRKDAKGRSSNPQTSGSAAGYAEVDPTPDY